MKTLTFGFYALMAMGSVVLAGSETYSSDKSTVTPGPCPQWYADNELNLSLSGVYALTGSPWREDTYLGVDHAWGGAIDAKYFMHRYFGFGVQGNVLSVNSNEVFDNGFTRFRAGGNDRHAVGSMLGTLTLRFPIGCSRFAPYAWLGGGAMFGGGRSHDFFLDPTAPPGFVRREFDESNTKGLGQVGGGLEIRLSPHVGLLNDFSWNIVSGSKNNFGMARTGINIAF
jgi:Outer membrane protein beta-barrel domain